MFKLNEKYKVDQNILICEFIRYDPSEISTINSANSQIYINIPREDSVILLLKSYFEIKYDVLHAAPGNRYADVDDIRLVNLGQIDLFSKYRLTISSGKLLEKIDHPHIVSLLYKLITSSGGSDDLSIGFDRSRSRRQQELTNNKKIEGKYNARIHLKDALVMQNTNEDLSDSQRCFEQL